MNQLAEAKRTQLLEEGLAIIYRSQVTPGHAQVALDLKPSLCLGVVEVVGERHCQSHIGVCQLNRPRGWHRVPPAWG